MRLPFRLASSISAAVAVLAAVIAVVGAGTSFADEPITQAVAVAQCNPSCYCDGLLFDPCVSDNDQILCFCSCTWDFDCSSVAE